MVPIRCVFVVLAPALIVAVAQSAAPPVPTPAWSEPLPRHAVARFGSPHFRHPHAMLLAYSPDGTMLASAGSGDGTIRLWNAGSGEELARLGEANMGQALTLAFAPNGQMLASLHGDGKVRLWDAGSGRLVRRLETKEELFPFLLAFAPDGRTLTGARRASSSVVLTWSLTTGREIERTELYGSPRTRPTMALAPDGTVIVSYRTGAMIWDKAARQARNGRAVLEKGKATGRVNHLALSGDGRVLGLFSRTVPTRLWDVHAGRAMPFTPEVPLAAGGWFSNNGKLLAVPTSKSTICIQDTSTSRLVSQWAWGREGVTAFAFAPDNRSFAVIERDGAIRIIEVHTGTERVLRASVRVAPGPVAFLPDGQSVVTGATDHSLRIWSVRTSQPVQSLTGHAAPIRGLALTRDGKVLASSSDDGNVRLWELPARRLRHSLKLPKRSGSCLALSPDGRSLVVGTDEGRIHEWNAVTGKETVSWVGHGKRVLSLAFGVGGKALLSTSGGGEPVRVWDATWHTSLFFWVGQRADTVVAVSADGKWAALASTGAPALRLWHVVSCEERTPESWRSAPPALAVAVSPDGKQVATGGPQGSVRLWDLPTGKLLRHLPGHQAPVVGLAYAPRGDRLASVSTDGTALVWDVTGGAAVPASPQWSEAGLRALCRDLAGGTVLSLKAYRQLEAAGPPAVKHLAALFLARSPADGRGHARLVRELDSDDFDTRERAQAELAELGERAEQALHEALAGKPGLEQYRRIERLLARLQRPTLPREWPLLRAVLALEKIGTPEARKRLEELARGGAGVVVTRAAKEALARRGKGKS